MEAKSNSDSKPGKFSNTKVVSINRLRMNPNDIRYFRDSDYIRQLAKSIEEFGLRMPIVVEDNKDGTYTIIDGHYRYLAIKLLKWTKVKVVVFKGSELDKVRLTMSISSNSKPFNPMDKLKAIKYLCEVLKLKPERVGELIGLKRRMVYYYLLIDKHLTEEEKLKLAMGKMSVREAIKLAIRRKSGVANRNVCFICREWRDGVVPMFFCPKHHKAVQSLVKNLLRLNSDGFALTEQEKEKILKIVIAFLRSL